jgi:FkbM family methyltransferase
MNMFAKFVSRLRAEYYMWQIRILGKARYRDKYGLRYYLWADSRPLTTITKRVRTDDTGVISQLSTVLDPLKDLDRPVVCIDVGAHAGIISLSLASRLGQSRIIHAFEPASNNNTRLQENIRLNDFGEVIHTHLLALSDEPGTGHLILTDDPGNHYLSGQSSGVLGNSELVKIDTLENFVAYAGITSVDLLKIDAEGADDKVLVGAGALLKDGLVSYVIAEVIEGEECGNRVLQILKAYSYDIYFIVRDTDMLVSDLQAYPRDQYKRPMNILAISPKAPFFQRGEGLNVITRQYPE